VTVDSFWERARLAIDGRSDKPAIMAALRESVQIPLSRRPVSARDVKRSTQLPVMDLVSTFVLIDWQIAGDFVSAENLGIAATTLRRNYLSAAHYHSTFNRELLVGPGKRHIFTYAEVWKLTDASTPMRLPRWLK
jgi:hypothetical protein